MQEILLTRNTAKQKQLQTKSKKQIYSRGAYVHFAVAIGLSSVLPLLALLYLLRSGPAESLSPLHWTIVGLCLLAIALSGYILLWRYPATIVRLRAYLDSIVNDELPEMIDLSAREQDIEGIETALNRVLEKLRQRLHQSEVQRNHLERQLFQTQKLEAVGTLAAGIAHEINTPLQFIGNNAEFIDKACRELLAALDRQADQPSWEDLDFLRRELPGACDNIDGGIARIANIIEALRDFSRGGEEERQQAADLNQAIETIVEVTRNRWKYQARMEVELDPSLPLVKCFPDEIKNTLANLILNSAQAIEQKRGQGDAEIGVIKVASRLGNTRAIVSIADNGCGIPEIFHSRIFDPFFTTREVNAGKGCGLTFAHTSIVKRHGGAIDFSSAENQGATFTLSLPLDGIAAGRDSELAADPPPDRRPEKDKP